MKKKILIPVALGTLLSFGVLSNINVENQKNLILNKADGGSVATFRTVGWTAENTNLANGVLYVSCPDYSGADNIPNPNNWIKYTGGTVKVDGVAADSFTLKIIDSAAFYLDSIVVGGNPADLTVANEVVVDGVFSDGDSTSITYSNLLVRLKTKTAEVAQANVSCTHEATNPTAGQIYVAGNQISSDIPVTWSVGYTGGSVKLNGNQVSSYEIKRVADGGNGFFVASPDFANATGVVTIDGTFSSTISPVYAISFDNVVIQYGKDYGTIDGTVTPATDLVAGNTAGYFVVSSPDGLPTTWDFKFAGADIKVNGFAADGARFMYVGKDTYYIEGLPTLAEGDTITINGKTRAKDKNWDVDRFYDVTFDLSISLPVSKATVEGAVTLQNVDGGNAFYFTTETMNNMPAQNWEVAFSYEACGVTFNDTNVEGCVLKYTPHKNGTLFFQVPDTYKYQSGTWKLNGLFTAGDAIINFNNVTIKVVNVEAGEFITGQTNVETGWLYLETNSTNDIPYDTAWEKCYLYGTSNDCLKVTRNGQTFNAGVPGNENGGGNVASKYLIDANEMWASRNFYAFSLSHSKVEGTETVVKDYLQENDIVTLDGIYATNHGDTTYNLHIDNQSFVYAKNSKGNLIWSKVANITSLSYDYGVVVGYPEASIVRSQRDKSETPEVEDWSKFAYDMNITDKIVLNDSFALRDIINEKYDGQTATGKYSVFNRNDASLRFGDVSLVNNQGITKITIKAGAELPTTNYSSQIEVVGDRGMAVVLEDVSFYFNGTTWVKESVTPTHTTDVGYADKTETTAYLELNVGDFVGSYFDETDPNYGWSGYFSPSGDGYIKYNGQEKQAIQTAGPGYFYVADSNPSANPNVAVGDTFEIGGHLVNIKDGEINEINILPSKFELTADGWQIVYDLNRWIAKSLDEADEYKADIIDAISNTTVKDNCVSLLETAKTDIVAKTTKEDVTTRLNEYKTAIDNAIAAFELDGTKAAAVNALNEYKADVINAISIQSVKDSIASIKSTFETNVALCENADEVNELLGEAKEDIDEVIAAYELEAYKTLVCSQIDLIASDLSAYRDAEKAVINSLVSQAKLDIAAASSTEEVNQIVEELGQDYEEVKTDFDYYKEEKVAALAYDESAFRAAEKTTIEAKKAEIATAIMAAESKTAADTEFAKFAAYVATVKTNADYEAEELVAEKASVLNAINAYVATIDEDKYTASNYQAIMDLWDDAKDEVNSATSKAALANVLDGLKAEVAKIPVIGNEPTTPEEPQAKKGCGGSMVAASALATTLAVAGVALLSKKKED